MIEYKVRPVIRFIVTKFEKDEYGGSSHVIGEFEHAASADHVVEALTALDKIPVDFGVQST